MQGLANLGNTCYINTLVQCIGHVDTFRQWILEKELGVSTTFTRELQNVLKLMWVDGNSIAPKRFVEAVHTLFPLERDDQHDIHELLMLFLDRISNEDTVLGEYNNDPPDKKVSEAYRALCERATKSWQTYHPKGFKSWDSLCEGLQIHQVQCNSCSKCFHNFEPFTVLNIELLESCSIQTAFNQLFKEESLQEWKCEQCNSLQKADKCVRLWCLPKVVIIVLKRFSFQDQVFRKITQPITIPIEIAFTNASVIGPSHKNQKYKLKSMALHHGGLDSGHYTCVALPKDDVWVHYDDLYLSRVDIENVCTDNTNAYVIMYERI